MRTSIKIVAIANLVCFIAALPLLAASVPLELMNQARRKGSVRVIVGLNVDARAEGLLSPQRAREQRAAIISAQRALLSGMVSHTFALRHSFRTIPFVVMDATPEALTALRRTAVVTSVTADTPLLPNLRESTALVGAPQAWAAGFTGMGQTIAILDTGVDTGHPFLAGKIVEEACFTSANQCPNGQASMVGPGAGSPCVGSPDLCWHGTAVAGVVAGSGSELSGVAPDAALIAVQVATVVAGDECYEAGYHVEPCAILYTSDVLQAYEHVYGLRDVHAIAAINASFGYGRFDSQETCDAQDPAFKAMVEMLRSVGIATVAGAGNDGVSNGLILPACLSPAISVGSVNDFDAVSRFSNSAPFLALLAPGEDITTSIPAGDFDTVLGTSFSAPHVAGALAVLRQAAPDATVDALRDALELSGAPVYDYRNGTITPRVQLDDALEVVRAAPAACFTRRVGQIVELPMSNTAGGVGVAAANLVAPACIGDCDFDGRVTIDNLLTGVRISLGSVPLRDCRPLDANGDARVTVAELIGAVNTALDGCPAPRGDVTALRAEVLDDLDQLVGVPELGQTVRFAVLVKVDGAAEVDLSVRASLDGAELTGCRMTAHASSGESTIMCQQTWVATLGAHQLRFELDAENALPEADETNNRANTNWDTDGPVDLDLRAGRAFLKDRAGPGGNERTTTAAGERIFLNLIWDAPGSALEGTRVHIRQRAALDNVPVCECNAVVEPGYSYASTCIEPWLATAGAHTLEWHLDVGDIVDEVDESNNTISTDWETTDPMP